MLKKRRAAMGWNRRGLKNGGKRQDGKPLFKL
jgi:hypothetical protein